MSVQFTIEACNDGTITRNTARAIRALGIEATGRMSEETAATVVRALGLTPVRVAATEVVRTPAQKGQITKARNARIAARTARTERRANAVEGAPTLKAYFRAVKAGEFTGTSAEFFAANA